jgi:hypothetical protein
MERSTTTKNHIKLRRVFGYMCQNSSRLQPSMMAMKPKPNKVVKVSFVNMGIQPHHRDKDFRSKNFLAFAIHAN